MKQWRQTHNNALPHNGEYERVAGSEKYKYVTEKKICRGEIRNIPIMYFICMLISPHKYPFFNF